MQTSKALFNIYTPMKNLNSIQSICKDCKFFVASANDTTLEFGKCTLYGDRNLVSGRLTFGYASVVREYICKGRLFEKNFLINK